MALKILQMVKIFVESGLLLCSLRAIDQGTIIQRKEAEKRAEKGAEGEINLKEGLEARYLNSAGKSNMGKNGRRYETMSTRAAREPKLIKTTT